MCMCAFKPCLFALLRRSHSWKHVNYYTKQFDFIHISYHAWFQTYSQLFIWSRSELSICVSYIITDFRPMDWSSVYIYIYIYMHFTRIVYIIWFQIYGMDLIDPQELGIYNEWLDVMCIAYSVWFQTYGINLLASLSSFSSDLTLRLSHIRFQICNMTLIGPQPICICNI